MLQAFCVLVACLLVYIYIRGMQRQRDEGLKNKIDDLLSIISHLLSFLSCFVVVDMLRYPE